MISKFFIDRPIFASVLSILIVLCGTLAIKGLPIAMFPEVVPPSISVTCNYPGADAKLLSETVAAPIEQQLSGAKNLLYFQSTAGNDGVLTIVVTFEVGADLDIRNGTHRILRPGLLHQEGALGESMQTLMQTLLSHADDPRLLVVLAEQREQRHGPREVTVVIEFRTSVDNR